MTIDFFESQNNVRLIPRSKSYWCRFIDFFSKKASAFFMTYRFPFQKRVTIVFPDKVNIKDEISKYHEITLKHELVHASLFSKWYGPVVVGLLYSLIPLPILFSGRWFIERKAYLVNIKLGERTPEQAAQTLWSNYFYAWPKSLMIKWFKKNM